MKIKFLLLHSILFITACSKNDFKVVVDNPSEFDRQNEMVEIPLSVAERNIKLMHGEVYVVKSLQGEIIPSQVTYDNKLIFQVDIRAKEAVAFSVAAGDPIEFSQKTYARFIPEDKNDFAWENDKITFRTYGQERIKTDGFSNGIDIGYREKYTVSNSLGTAVMAPYVNDSLWLNENFISYEILDNGPIRITFCLKYKDIEVDGKTLAETRTISLDAGSYFTKVIQEYKGVDKEMSVAAGFLKKENDSVIISMEDNYILYVNPIYKNMENVFLGMIFPSGLKTALVDQYRVKNNVSAIIEEYSHILGIVTYEGNKPVTYYTGFGWSESGFGVIGEFQEHMDNFSKSLTEPLKINY